MYTHTVNGGWSAWRPGKCSVTCGQGFLQLTRECNNPRPANGGRHCVGTDRYLRHCNKGCCPGNNKLESNAVKIEQHSVHHVLTLV